MSTTRTPDIIQQEYTKLAAELGHISFQIALFESRKPVLIEAFFKLNAEMTEANKPKVEVAPGETL